MSSRSGCSGKCARAVAMEGDKKQCRAAGEDAGAQARALRRRRYRTGLAAERIAAAWLVLKGYRILGTRVRTPVGEVDLIAVRLRRIAFVEVKRRANLEEAEASVGWRQRQRVRDAADLWLARNPGFRTREIGFDIIFLLPRRWPIHIRNGL
jgi:putative endonuclease